MYSTVWSLRCSFWPSLLRPCLQLQILHSSSQEEQEPLTHRRPPPPPTQAPPPAHPRSARPESAPDCPDATAATTEEAKDCGRGVRKEEDRERRGAHTRSLLPPQPSKLRLFLSHTSSSAVAAPPRAKAASTSGSSRLPKPKSHWGVGLVTVLTRSDARRRTASVTILNSDYTNDHEAKLFKM